MKIKEIGEFGLIEKIKARVSNPSKDVIVGIGDDAAVLSYDKKSYMLFTTDSLVENVHFSLEHWTAKQIGMKAIEQNVSDIACMGGIPRHALISLSLPENIDAEFIDEIYHGIEKTSKKYKVSIVGGNITCSKEIIVTVCIIGFVEKKYLALRSGAKVGDFVFCSGNVGGSAAGLELLKHKLYGKSIKKHLEPRCRLDLARRLIKVGISSMTDVSDGIALQVRRICEQSNIGAVIYADKIPISQNTITDAKKLGKSALDFALYGGEDFELVFTAGKSKLNALKKYDVSVIGEIIGKKDGIKLVKNGEGSDLVEEFDHF